MHFSPTAHFSGYSIYITFNLKRKKKRNKANRCKNFNSQTFTFAWDIKLILNKHCLGIFLKLKGKLKPGVEEGWLIAEAVLQHAQVPVLPGIFPQGPLKPRQVFRAQSLTQWDILSKDQNAQLLNACP